MFSKGTKPHSSSAARGNGAPSVVGADTRIIGDIVSDGEVHVDGHITGDVRCQILMVGLEGSINGEIIAETVQILGGISGKVQAQTIVLAKTAKVIGDITHETLEIEAGAYMEGRCARLGSDGKPQIPEDRTDKNKANGKGQGQASLPPPKDGEAKTNTPTAQAAN